jgi:hypothetical protein
MSTARAPYITSPEGMAALGGAFHRTLRLYQPPEFLTLSQWADKYAFIPKESGAFPGKFQTSFAEYQRGIQDAISDPEIESVILMMSAQSVADALCADKPQRGREVLKEPNRQDDPRYAGA